MKSIRYVLLDLNVKQRTTIIRTVAAKKWVREIGDSGMIDEKDLSSAVSMSTCWAGLTRSLI